VELKDSDLQQDIRRSVSGHIRRLRSLADDNAGEGSDTTVLSGLLEEGFLDLAKHSSLVDATVVVEEAARAAVNAPIASRALVVPMLGIELPLRVGLVEDPRGSVVRFGHTCDAFVAIDGDTARVAAPDQCHIEQFSTRFGYPMARVEIRNSLSLGSDTAKILRCAWQLAIAVELAGLSAAALAHTVEYVTQRQQFGRPIGSFQAVQHRLATSHIHVQAALWLARQAAANVGDEYLTATAATVATHAALMTHTDTHQVSGAMGITTEHGLVKWTMKMLALQQELGGRRAHARRVVATRMLSRNGTRR
jgi:Acyl-CoA dehydrogenase, C-terminal domain